MLFKILLYGNLWTFSLGPNTQSDFINSPVLLIPSLIDTFYVSKLLLT